MAEHADSAESILAEDGDYEPEEGFEPEDQDDADGAEEDSEPEGEQEAQDRDPLPPDELKRRWEDTKKSRDQERRLRQEQDQKISRMEEAFQRILQGQQQPKQQEPEIPNPSEDPIGFLEWQREQYTRQQQAETAQREQQARIQQQSQRLAQTAQRLTTIESEYQREVAPDYYEAIDHWKNARAQQLAGWGMDQRSIHHQMIAEVAELGEMALQRGINPAEAAYNMAKSWGYRRQSQAPQQNIERTRQGMRSSKTLSGGGKSAKGQMTLAQIADLDGDDFDKAFAAARAANR